MDTVSALAPLTLAQLNSARAASLLVPARLYYVTDKETVALATAADAYRYLEAPMATWVTGWDLAKAASGTALLDGGAVVSFSGAAQAVCMSEWAPESGQYYAEVVVYGQTYSGDCAVGLCPATQPLNTQIGYDGAGQDAGLYQLSGNIYVDGLLSTSMSSFNHLADVVCLAYDADARKAWWRVNDGQWNGSIAADPGVLANGIALSGSDPLFLGVCTPQAVLFRGVFEAPFHQTVPTGFAPWADIGPPP